MSNTQEEKLILVVASAFVFSIFYFVFWYVKVYNRRRREFEEVVQRLKQIYGNEYIYQRVSGTRVNLYDLKNNQSVVSAGANKNWHILMTRIENEEENLKQELKDAIDEERYEDAEEIKKLLNEKINSQCKK